MILTKDLIYSVQGVNGGWNNAQLKLMGVDSGSGHAFDENRVRIGKIDLFHIALDYRSIR